MTSRLCCILSALLLAACAAASPAPQPAEPPVGSLVAAPLDGPFVSGEAFCARLGKPACQPDERLLMMIEDHKAPLTLRSGAAVKLRTYASRDAVSQQSHLLIESGGALWALPAINPHDPARGVRASAITMRFKQDEPAEVADDMFMLTVSATLELEPGGQAEYGEVSYYCKAGEAVRCVAIPTSSLLMDGVDGLNMIRGATVLPIIKEAGGVADISDIGAFQYGERHDMERRTRLPAEGKHRLVFP